MQFSNAITIIIATLAASALAAPQAADTTKEERRFIAKPTDKPTATPTLAALEARQSQEVDSTHPDKESAQNALDDNRAEGRRKLSATSADCKNADCHTCMNASTVASLAEVATCGMVFAAAEVGTGGAATAFVVAGFAACETAIVANMAKSVLECQGMNP